MRKNEQKACREARFFSRENNDCYSNKKFTVFIDISCVFYYIKTTKFQRKNTGQKLTLGLDSEKR